MEKNTREEINKEREKPTPAADGVLPVALLHTHAAGTHPVLKKRKEKEEKERGCVKINKGALITKCLHELLEVLAGVELVRFTDEAWLRHLLVGGLDADYHGDQEQEYSS